MQLRQQITIISIFLLSLTSLVGCEEEGDTVDEAIVVEESDTTVGDSGSDLDRSKWCTRYIYGGGETPQIEDPECQKNDGSGSLDFLNDERQRYRDFNRSGEAMHVVNNGVLQLRATKTRTDDDYANFESAMIRSKELFKPSDNTSYYLTARLMMSNVVGTWPAFWLNSDRDVNGNTTWPPEIDIIDAALNGVDDRVDMLHQSAISKGKQTDSGKTEYTFTSPEFDEQWKNFHANNDVSLRNKWVEVSAEWTKNEVCYFVDGYKTMCEKYRWVLDDGNSAPPAHVLLNLAIGGQWAGRYGVGEEFLENYSAQETREMGLSTTFPTQLGIDFVRIYSRTNN